MKQSATNLWKRTTAIGSIDQLAARLSIGTLGAAPWTHHGVVRHPAKHTIYLFIYGRLIIAQSTAQGHLRAFDKFKYSTS